MSEGVARRRIGADRCTSVHIGADRCSSDADWVRCAHPVFVLSDSLGVHRFANGEVRPNAEKTTEICRSHSLGHVSSRLGWPCANPKRNHHSGGVDRGQNIPLVEAPTVRRMVVCTTAIKTGRSRETSVALMTSTS